MNKNNIDLSIIGLGAASYAAALYAVRYQIPTVMIGVIATLLMLFIANARKK